MPQIIAVSPSTLIPTRRTVIAGTTTRAFSGRATLAPAGFSGDFGTELEAISIRDGGLFRLPNESHGILGLATWGNSGIEPDEGQGISSPGTYAASLTWPCNDGSPPLFSRSQEPWRLRWRRHQASAIRTRSANDWPHLPHHAAAMRSLNPTSTSADKWCIEKAPGFRPGLEFAKLASERSVHPAEFIVKAEPCNIGLQIGAVGECLAREAPRSALRRSPPAPIHAAYA
jgi:hypothetical protein